MVFAERGQSLQYQLLMRKTSDHTVDVLTKSNQHLCRVLHTFALQPFSLPNTAPLARVPTSLLVCAGARLLSQSPGLAEQSPGTQLVKVTLNPAYEAHSKEL
jgi:protein gp37